MMDSPAAEFITVMNYIQNTSEKIMKNTTIIALTIQNTLASIFCAKMPLKLQHYCFNIAYGKKKKKKNLCHKVKCAMAKHYCLKFKG